MASKQLLNLILHVSVILPSRAFGCIGAAATGRAGGEYQDAEETDMEIAIVSVAIIAFIAFRQWMQHDRRVMTHRERLAAIEKGAPLPEVERELARSSWNAQRVLLLAGLSWISVGIGAFIVLTAVIYAFPLNGPPQGMQWIGVPLVGIGLSHLVVYWTGRRKDL